MANEAPVPSLSTQGWIRDPATKMDRLLSHFFLSDYNQTALHPNNVFSLQRIIQKNNDDISKIIDSIRNSLNEYLSRHYNEVTVTVNGSPDPITNPSIKMDINVSIVVIDKGLTETYENLIKTENSKFSGIIKINNFGQ